MSERHPRNAGLPAGISLTPDGARYVVRGPRAIPGEFVTGWDGTVRPKTRNVRIGRARSIEQAIQMRAAYLREFDARGGCVKAAS